MNQKTINDEYFSDLPHSFGGEYRLIDKFGKENKKLIQDALGENDIYTRFKQFKKLRYYSPTYVYRKRQLLQADIVFFNKKIQEKDWSTDNDGYKYLFTCIDVFTKFAWAFPLKENTCANAIKCFKEIIKDSQERIENVQTDFGSEFKCKELKAYFKKEKINHYFSRTDRKCAVVERFNLSLQSIIYKMLEKGMTLRWIDMVKPAMKVYLSREHRTIGMSPREGEVEKNHELLRQKYLAKYVKASLRKKKPKFKVGDTVRIYHGRTKFERGYLEKFTGEHFIIRKVYDNLILPRYELSDWQGQEVKNGIFFENELVKYNPSEYFNSSIIGKKGKGKNLKYLVKYQGWPDIYNEWKKPSELKALVGQFKKIQS